jgi:RNA polymerase sigma-70 factor (ECF subfamily)
MASTSTAGNRRLGGEVRRWDSERSREAVGPRSGVHQAGDPSAFDELYRRYFDRLHRFCQRHTGDVHEAEEIAQEAFVKALRSMDALTGERRFYPWMTVIAKRLTIDRHRKLSRLELTDEPDLGSVEPDVEHLFAAVDAGHVRHALAAVGPRHREVLLLREAQGLSYAEIGDQLDVPVTTVEAHVGDGVASALDHLLGGTP